MTLHVSGSLKVCYNPIHHNTGISIMTEQTEQDLGLIAYQQGDYETAFAEWHKLALNDNPQACHNIAMLYEMGQGVEQDLELAKHWCEQAIKLGLVEAQHHLGYLLLESDPIAALECWQKAAEAGLAQAQYDLGGQYAAGDIIPQDNDTAADWYEEAAMQGHTEAQFHLGVLYANAEQYANARHWWLQAAEQGHELAQFNLQRMKEMGL
ncbi:tetratricopeptide repeat protein [Alysiella crassa]|nr:tetratricopeptide repeat protein [Alysiella crassa]